MQTKHGNVKMFNHKLVSNWVLKWIGSKSSREISKVFDVSGFVPVDQFQLEELHYELNLNFNKYFLKKCNITVKKLKKGDALCTNNARHNYNSFLKVPEKVDIHCARRLKCFAEQYAQNMFIRCKKKTTATFYVPFT